MNSPELAMAAALNGRAFGSNGAKRTTLAPATTVPAKQSAVLPPIALRPHGVHIGDAEIGGPVGVDLAKLIEGRLLIQGASGAGKSWTLRRLLEQTYGLIQQIVVDPEGEFGELGERLEMVRLEGHRLDIATLALAAARAREHRASCLLDLSELDRDEQLQAVAAFFPPLVSAPREQWRPCLVAIDEAHLFAPHGGFSEATSVRKAAIAAVTDVMSRGRKRGLAGVLATQRLARLAKSVSSEALNFMVGLNTLDLDIRRAAETIGWDARKGFDRLPALTPGDFVAVGPAFSRGPVVLRVGPVETRHAGATPKLLAPKSMMPREAAKLLDLEALMHASSADQAAREERAQAPGLRQVRAFIRDDAFSDAGRVWGALLKVAPEGAAIADLARHLNRKPEQVTAALVLLDQFGAVEFTGADDKRAARVAKGMLP